MYIKWPLTNRELKERDKNYYNNQYTLTYRFIASTKTLTLVSCSTSLRKCAAHPGVRLEDRSVHNTLPPFVERLLVIRGGGRVGWAAAHRHF